MSNYKPYPKYKESGVAWLGEVPEGWEVLHIKRLCFVKRGASPRPIENPIYFDENGEYAWVRISDVTSSDMYLEKTIQKLSALGKSLSVPLEPNDLFLSIAGSVGKPMIANIKCCIHDGFVYFQRYKESLKFLYWVFKSGQPYLGLGKFGTQLNLNKDTVGDIKIGLPPLKEQTQIATYLDQKTKKIDTLIEKQQTLIELLKEKRQALISHVVTKGLDDSVPMKESGVAWLGEVPEGWEVYKLKYAVEKIGDTDHYMPKSILKGKPYLMTGDIEEKASLIDFENCKQVLNEDFIKLSKKIKSDIGDLIFARYATIGTVCYVDVKKDFLVSYACVTIKPNISKMIGKYLFYFFKSSSFLEGIKSYINSNTQGNVGIDSLYRMKLVIPPLKEQTQIANYLDEKTKKIDTLIEKSKQSIELLKERRTALISAVVTGKVKVTDE